MTVLDDRPGTVPFSEELRGATSGDHADAERSPAMQALLGGTMTRHGYAVLLAQHLQAYRVLEAAAERLAHDPVAGPFVDPALARSDAIAADLDVLVGADVAAAIPASAATERYRRRIEEVSSAWPAGFVAHHYVRYLGDLSGGQFLRRLVQRAFDVTDERGASYYAFDALGDLDAYKAAYRRRLDEAPWDADERARIVDEVHLAYRLSTEVLATA